MTESCFISNNLVLLPREKEKSRASVKVFSLDFLDIWGKRGKRVCFQGKREPPSLVMYEFVIVDEKEGYFSFLADSNSFFFWFVCQKV
jgi:hypothetical protein